MLSAVAAFSERARIAFIQLLTFILIENNVSIDPQGMARMRPRKRHVDPYSLHNSPPKAPLHLILLFFEGTLPPELDFHPAIGAARAVAQSLRRRTRDKNTWQRWLAAFPASRPP